MFTKSPDGLTTAGAFLYLLVFLCLLLFSTLADATPFQTRDQNPLNLIHGQPLPTYATLPEPERFEWSTSIDIANTLNGEQSGNEEIILDYESYFFNTGFSYRFAKDWVVKLDVPLSYHGAGQLDSAIDNWHDLFSLPRASRPLVADDQFQISYINNGIEEVLVVDSQQGLGDIQLSTGWQFIDDSETALSLWAGIDLPTGDLSHLTGNDKIDVSFWMASNHQTESSLEVFSNLGLLLPGADKLVTTEVASSVWFGHAGMSFVPFDSLKELELQVQLNGHSSFYENSSLRLLSSAAVLVFGGSYHLDSCTELTFAVSEDIKVEASPDVSFLISLQKRGACKP